MQTRSEGAGAEENYVIWMPVENMLMEAQRASADLPAWDSHGGCNGTSKSDLCVRVGLAVMEKARRRFHNQDKRFNDSNRGVPVRTTWAIGPIPSLHDATTVLGCALDLVR